MNPRVLQQMLAGDGVVVSREIARDLGIRAGDELTLPTPTGERRVRVLEVVPYFSLFGGARLDEPDTNARVVRPARVDDSGRQAGARRGSRRGRGGDPGSAARRRRSCTRVKRQWPPSARGWSRPRRLIDAMAWIVVFVASIALLNTLMLSVLERRRELGVMRAMGASRRFVLRTVIAEAAGIGTVGAVIGAAFGAVNQYLTTSALTNVLSIDVVYAASVLAIVFACAAFALTLLGAIPPAVRAARLDIVARRGSRLARACRTKVCWLPCSVEGRWLGAAAAPRH